jgi:nucleoside-diphosphate-sugar epimerase
MEKNRVLISGGAGFIGSHLVDEFLKRGWKVTVVDNLLTGRIENIEAHLPNPNFTFHQIAVEDYKPKGDEKFSLILHLASAASPKDYQKFPIETLKAESFGTFRLLDIARVMGARFVLASTSEVYGDPLVHPQPESYWGNVNPIGPRSVYDEAKRFAEACTMAYFRSYDLDTRILRIFNTYGPRMREDDGRVVPTFIVNALLGKPLPIFGDGTQTRSFCFVSDTVAAIVQVSERDDLKGVIINIGNPREMTIIELARVLEKVLGRKLELDYHPLPTDDPKRRKPDISLIKRLLGWEPKVSLEEGLKRTVNWFKERVERGVSKS